MTIKLIKLNSSEQLLILYVDESSDGKQEYTCTNLVKNFFITAMAFFFVPKSLIPLYSAVIGRLFKNVVSANCS